VPVEQKRPDKLHPFRNEIHTLHWFDFGGKELSEGGDTFSVAAEGFGGGNGSVLPTVLGDGDVVGHFDGEVYHGRDRRGGEVGFEVAPLPRAGAVSVPAGRRRFRIRWREATESGIQWWWQARGSNGVAPLAGVINGVRHGEAAILDETEGSNGVG